MRTLICLFLCGLSLSGLTQTKGEEQKIMCEGLGKLSIKPTISLNGSIQKGFLKRDDIIRSDIRISLSDPTFKIIGFIGGYDCHSRALFEFSQKEYFGNTIKAGDKFILGVWIGDIFVIDCINIEKGGKRYLLDGMQFKIY